MLSGFFLIIIIIITTIINAANPDWLAIITQ